MGLNAKPGGEAEGFIYARLLNVQPTGLDVDALHALIESDLGGMLDQLPSRQLETLLAILFEKIKALVLRLKRVTEGEPSGFQRNYGSFLSAWVRRLRKRLW